MPTAFKDDFYPLLDDELACDDIHPVIFELAAIQRQNPAE
jgi:hypothetical protein